MNSTYQFTPITEKEYAQLLKKTSFMTFYNCSERLGFIQKRNRKTGLFKVVTNDSAVALISYQVIPAKSGAFVYFQHSPLFIDTRVAESVSFWQELRQFAVGIGAKEQAVYIRFTPRILNEKTIAADIMSAGFRRAPVQELDASITRTIAIDQFSPKTLRQDIQDDIAKAEKKNLSVTVTKDAPAVEDFVSIYRTLAAKKQIDYVPVDYLKDELKTYHEAGMLWIANVHDEKDTLYASAVIVTYGDLAWYYWAAVSDQGKDAGADSLMLLEVIAALAKQKIRVLDLWGGSISKEVEKKALPHPWKEMDRFKQGFGATLVEYVPAIDIPVKSALYLAAVFYQRALMTKRGYPYVPLAGK